MAAENSVINEEARQIPVWDHFDVVVAGAGPAGIGAALAAARAGAKTCLLEYHGCLGGVWTAGALSWVIDAADKTGLISEIAVHLEKRGARAVKKTRFAYDVEQMKLLLEELCVEAGVKIRLHTKVVGAKVEEGRLTGIITESRSGRQGVTGKVFIDTTGDGELGALAGCHFEYGHPETGRAQPMSLVALLTGIDADEIAPFVGGGVKEAKINLLAEFKRLGVTPSYGGPTLFPVRKDFFAMVANHEYGVSPMDADEVTAATVRARKEVNHLIQTLRNAGGCWRNIRLVATGAQIGIREGRRLRGHYMVSLEDMIEGRRHEEAVCRVNAGIDVHSTNPKEHTQGSPENHIRTLAYDVPLKALIARDVTGLMMAGRCISGDFFAHSSYRMTGNAVAMGEAAGIVASVAVQEGLLPHEVSWDSIKGPLDELRAGAALACKELEAAAT